MYLAFMLLHLYPGIYLLCMLLSTFMMIHRHEHIYSIYLPILSMLSSGTCFQLSIPFMAPMLLYFYMIHISLQPPALALVLSIYKKYIPFICLFLSLGVYSTGARYAWHILSIYLLPLRFKPWGVLDGFREALQCWHRPGLGGFFCCW